MWNTNDDDDQDFLNPSGGSKLASLFGGQAQNSGNESLKYTAPKQPKAKKSGEQAQTQATSGAPSLIQASAVHAYKYVEGQYTSQGKLGMALLGSPTSGDYRILLYKSKQQQVTNAKITPAFTFTVQPNNYATFYDDGRQNWSLAFDTEAAVNTFSKQVALGRVNSSSGALDCLISQDLVLGQGGALETGDSVEVKYTGWLYRDHAYGPEFDSNATAEKLFRFKTGKGKVIKGWDEGIVGMKKDGKRLLIVPPAMAYGSEGKGVKVPPDSTLIFEIEVIRIKKSKDKDSAASSPAPTPVKEIEQNTTQSATAEESFKAKAKAVDDSLNTASKTDKAKLISRMAKMGKPMLPMMGASASDNEEEETEEQHHEQTPEPVVEPVSPKPKIASKPVPQHTVHAAHTAAGASPKQSAFHAPQPTTVLPPQQIYNPMMQQPTMQAAPGQMAVYQSPMQMPGMPPMMMPPYQQPMYQQPYQQPPPPPQPAQQPAPAPPSNDSSLIVSETRQSSSEIRMAISRISDKVDRVYEKLDTVNNSSSNSLMMTSNMPNMETTVLIHNIQRIITENERLKKDVFEKSSKIDAQNEKIAELLEKNQKFVEQSNQLLEQRNDSFKSTASQSQAKVLTLEQEKVQFSTELSAATSQISVLQLELNTLKKREVELRQQLDDTLSSEIKLKDDVTQNKLHQSESERKVEQLTNELKEERHNRKSSENKLAVLQEELVDTKSSYQTLENVASERKKKTAEEKEKLEKELEEARAQFAQEISHLKDKLRRQNSSNNEATSEHVANIEKELNAEWKEKLDRMLANAGEKHQRELVELKQENGLLESKISDLEGRVNTLKAKREELDVTLQTTQEELDEFRPWKEKYDKLRSQAGSMKDKFESRITELEEEMENAEVKKAEIIQRARDLQSKQQQRINELESREPPPAAATGTVDKTVMITKVKGIMNQVFHKLRGEFDAEENYDGQKIHAAILNTIKAVTLDMTKEESQPTSESKEDNQQDEEETESEEEEEIEKESANIQKSTESNQQSSNFPKSNPTDNSNLSASEPVKTAVEIDRSKTDSNLRNDVQGAGDIGKGDEVLSDKSSQGNVTPPLSVSQTEQDIGAIQNGEDIVNESVIESSESQNTQSVSEDPTNEIEPETIKTASSEEVVDNQRSRQDKKENPRDILSETSTTEEVIQKSADVSQTKEEILEVTVDKTPKETEVAQTEPEAEKSSPEMEQATADVTQSMKELTISDDITPASTDVTKTDVVEKSEELEDLFKNEPSTDQAQDIIEEPMISASTGVITGDRGNQGYADELNKESLKDVVEESISASSGVITGDRGNPSYAEELNKDTPQDVIEEPLMSASTGPITGDRSNQNYREQLNQDTVNDIIEEPMISASTGPITGDRGNQEYADDLNKKDTVNEIVEEPMISASTGPKTGDLGDQLEKTDTTQDIVEEPIISATTGPSTGGRGNQSYEEQLNQKDPVEDIVEEPMISASTGPVTGDRGNQEYGEQLNKDTVQGNIEEPMISASTGPTTGDRAEQLNQKDRSEVKQNSETSLSANIDIVEEPVIAASILNTGDRGNTHYDEQLAKNKEEADSQPITEADTSADDVIEKPITAAVAPITGDRGNYHYAEQLLKKDKVGNASPEQEVKENINEEVIVAVSQPKTGDKGNTSYAQQLLDNATEDGPPPLDEDTQEDDDMQDLFTGDGESKKEEENIEEKKTNGAKDTKSSSLFGEEDDEDLFSPGAKKTIKAEKKTEKPAAKNETKSTATKLAESDDDMKPKPPPLFGSDDDDEDLDWLSK